jgi:two-component system sensor histidine kinase DegS
VRFVLDQTQACLEVEDNGRGFDVPKRWITLARQGHMGLVGAQERAEAAGGKLLVESRPSKGTLIRVTVPRSSKQASE